MIGAIKFVFICNASVGFTFMFMYEQIVYLCRFSQIFYEGQILPAGKETLD